MITYKFKSWACHIRTHKTCMQLISQWLTLSQTCILQCGTDPLFDGHRWARRMLWDHNVLASELRPQILSLQSFKVASWEQSYIPNPQSQGWKQYSEPTEITNKHNQHTNKNDRKIQADQWYIHVTHLYCGGDWIGWLSIEACIIVKDHMPHPKSRGVFNLQVSNQVVWSSILEDYLTMVSNQII